MIVRIILILLYIMSNNINDIVDTDTNSGTTTAMSYANNTSDTSDTHNVNIVTTTRFNTDNTSNIDTISNTDDTNIDNSKNYDNINNCTNTISTVKTMEITENLEAITNDLNNGMNYMIYNAKKKKQNIKILEDVDSHSDTSSNAKKDNSDSVSDTSSDTQIDSSDSNNCANLSASKKNSKTNSETQMTNMQQVHNSDPLTMIFSSLFQDLIKPTDENTGPTFDIMNMIEQLKKESNNPNIFGFDIKFDPENKLTSCVFNPDVINDPNFKINGEENNGTNNKNHGIDADNSNNINVMNHIDDENDGDENDGDDDENEKDIKKIKIKKNLRKNYVKNTSDEKLYTLDDVNKNIKIDKSLVDFYSSIGEISKLDNWFNCVNKEEMDTHYTCMAIDSASLNNKIEVLNWWLDKNKNQDVQLKYTSKSLDEASKLGHVLVLDWWFNSGLELKYTERAINNAVVNGKIRSLNWWLSKSKESKKCEKSKIEFNYTEESFNRCKLDEYELLELANLWNKNKLEFKYGKEFMDFISEWKYLKLHKYLMDNKMIKKTDILQIKPTNPPMVNRGNMGKTNVINIMDLINGERKKNKPTYDTTNFPENIIKHIEEKEAELDNNMSINGKAKEYIDSLVKIPFGKFRQEKIFKFMEDFLNKINELVNKTLNSDNSKESTNNDIVIQNNTMSNINLLNESDVLKFFNLESNQVKYSKLYNLYIEFAKLRVKYLEYVDAILNSTIYGHESTKKQFKCIIGQWLSGKLGNGTVIGVQGPPGVGKTSLVKGALAKCLVDFIDYDLDVMEPIISLQQKSEYNSRPFSFISLGGSANGSTLIGHNITYHGSTHGDIVKCLKQAKVMNPILFFDELDKISKTETGYEISSVLTHITDPVQNEHFTDRYFNEVSIDLSKAIIVFSYNDATRIDRILLDRIKEINVNALNVKEKIQIAKQFLVPEIIKNMGYSENDIRLTDNQISKLVLEFTFEAGVRKLKEKIEEVIRSAHLERILTQNLNPAMVIEDDYIQTIMDNYPKMHLKKINFEPKIGCINGMYATSNGIGDIMYIQIKKMYSKDILSLQTTGSLEKVILESMNVAKTVAWNLLDRIKQNSLINSMTNTGLHIHCPDGSTSKDGPSAGAAITCAIYSLFTNKPIKNDISMTGEIDLDGNITAIGGLDAKLSGAKRAGVKIAYVPEENKRDVDILLKKNPELVDSTFKVDFLSHINQAITKIF